MPLAERRWPRLLRRACRAWTIWCSSPACSKRRASAAPSRSRLQARDQATDVPAQQLVRRAHRGAVARPVDPPQARRAAAPHLGVEAALPLGRLRQRPAAAPSWNRRLTNSSVCSAERRPQNGP